MATHAKSGMFHVALPQVTLTNMAQPFVNAFTAIRKANKAAADARALMSYDDRQLADIGISRSEINALVYGKSTKLR